ncbi:lasso RiPP family leader peptide-containing protein [Micromonospora sp. NPDC023633]|uniref:lasso RiPP family leader peptide-containing protein n=1 Tax=Micromonospora sp. NPDC023633 TaxID=3154320 RepID=UPI003406E257
MDSSRISSENDKKVGHVRDYQAPRVERLGTLAELTQGGTGPIGDGQGGTGDSL